MATLILPILRLTIQDMRDQGSIAIADLSSYDGTPTSIALQITPPGWPTIGVPFTPGSVNVYKCGDLGIICALTDCCPMPDGIYAVTYTVTFANNPPESITKTFIKVDQLECRQMNLFLKIDTDCDCETKEQRNYKEQLREVDLLKSGAVAAANDSDVLLASKLYTQADKWIDHIYAQFCSTCSPVPSCDTCN